MSSTPQHIGLLTHLSRSGSTLLARMLDDFDDICVTTEAELPLELFGVKSYTPIRFRSEAQIIHYLDDVLSRTRMTSWKLSREKLLQRCTAQGFPLSGPNFIKVLLLLYGQTYKPQAKMVIYKACPLMPWHVSASMKHFPEAKYIHMIRDPRAVFHSQANSLDPVTGKPFSSSALKTAMDWKLAASIDQSSLQTPIHEIKYEDLISETDQVLKGLLRYLDIKDQSKTGSNLSFVSRMDGGDQNLHQEISSEPDTRKALTWQTNLTAKKIELIDTFLADLIPSKGYELFANPGKGQILTKIHIWIGIRYEKSKIFLKRATRVLKSMRSNPLYLFRKSMLKVNHG